MVGGNHLHDALFYTLSERLHILHLPKWRIHFESSVILGNVVSGKDEMMRAHLSRYRNAFLLCHPHQIHRPFRGAMTQMKMHSGILCKKDVTSRNNVLHGIGNAWKSQLFALLTLIHHAVLPSVRVTAQVNLFAMSKDPKPVLLCYLHSFPVESRVHHRLAILRKCNTSCLGHPLNIGKLFSLLSHCDCSKLDHMNRGLLLCPAVYFLHFLFRIDDRLRVWHGADSRHTAPGRCLPSGL